MEPKFSFGEKLIVLRYCLAFLGWKGLIGYPIVNAFISLICYYLIGILSQLIRIGARGLNGLVGQLDKSGFVTRAEFMKEISHNKTLKKELAVVNDENKDLVEFKHNAQKEYNDVARRLDEAERNILSNGNFQRNFEEVLLFLLHKYKKTPVKNIRVSEIHDNYFRVINGSWYFYTNQSFDKNRGLGNTYKINDSKVSNLNNEEVGEIHDLRFDKQYRILEFSITLKTPSRKDYYNLITISNDELLGFCNDQFCHVKRVD